MHREMLYKMTKYFNNTKFMLDYLPHRELTEAAVLMNLNTRFDRELIYVSQYTVSNGVIP